MIFGMSVWTILIISLASFRLTRLIVFDKITEFIRSPFFDEMSETDEAGEESIYLVPKSKGIRKWIGELLSCYWCTGVWASTFLVLLHYFYPEVGEPLIVIMAVAGIASILETCVSFLLER